MNRPLGIVCFFRTLRTRRILRKLDESVELCNELKVRLDETENILRDLSEKCHMSDNVNHPKHYNDHPSGIECIEITRHYCFSIGNAIKYLWRAGLKKDASLSDREKEIEDLKKAIWYINDRIEQLKKEK